jgi:Pilus formation protein N terminal region
VRRGATDRAILVFGKAVGTTNVVVVDDTDQEVFSATVVTADAPEIGRLVIVRGILPPTDRNKVSFCTMIGPERSSAPHLAGRAGSERCEVGVAGTGRWGCSRHLPRRLTSRSTPDNSGYRSRHRTAERAHHGPRDHLAQRQSLFAWPTRSLIY